MSFAERRHRIATKAGEKALIAIEGIVERASLVPTTPFLDPARFDWVAPLETHWRAIRGELDSVLAHLDQIPAFQEISTDQKSITTDNRWKTFFLYGMGFKAEKNCARCPETTRLIEAVPGMTTAFFSILAPGKHIPAHRGPYKGFLRYHLGLKVPEQAEQCRIRVDDEIRHWTEGESLLFDDTYDHEVWNDTDETRAVLFMDVLRPMKAPVAAMNRGVLRVLQRTGFVQKAKKNQEAWEADFERAVQPG